jgi:hypothetical protein
MASWTWGHSSVCKKLYAQAGNYEGIGLISGSTGLVQRHSRRPGNNTNSPPNFSPKRTIFYKRRSDPDYVLSSLQLVN